MKQLKNKNLFNIIFFYIIVTMNLSIKNITLYRNIVNPIFRNTIILHMEYEKTLY